MAPPPRCAAVALGLFFLFASSSEAKRNEAETSQLATDTERTADACGSQRCNGFTDAEGTSTRLEFRDPSKFHSATPVHGNQIAGLESYHRSELSDCKPLGFSIGDPDEDWATSVEHGGETYLSEYPQGDYMCAEKCTVTFFDAVGVEKDSKKVWVDRKGRNGAWSFAWKPPTCKVGNAVQQHMWGQLQTFRGRSDEEAEVMVTSGGLPVWKLDSNPARLAVLIKDFAKKFCALDSDEKRNKVVLHSEQCDLPFSAGEPQFVRIAKNPECMPSGFPKSCEKDGSVLWKLADQKSLKVNVRSSYSHP